MTDTQTSSGAGAMPATGTPATGIAPSGATPPAATSTLEEALKRIAELERTAANKTEEAARHGKSLSAAEKELASYKEKERLAQEAALTEVEKANKKAADLEARIKEQQQKLIDAQVRLSAQSKGVHPDMLDLVALALNGKLDASAADFDAKLDAALDELLAAKPMLKVSESGTRYAPPTGANNPGRANVAQPGTLPAGRITLDQLYRDFKK